jgi:hypothetical protein
LEHAATNDLSELRRAGCVPSSHGQQNAPVWANSRLIKAYHGVARRTEARTCHEQVDTASDPVCLKHRHLRDDPQNLAFMVWEVNGDMHFVRRNCGKGGNHTLIA